MGTVVLREKWVRGDVSCMQPVTYRPGQQSNPYAAWLVTTDERTRYAPNYEQYASDRWARLEWNLNLAST
jgi:hypothetical protein